MEQRRCVGMEKVKIDIVLKIKGAWFLSRLYQKGFEPGGSNTENCKINFFRKANCHELK